MMREAAIFGKNCRQNENPGELGLRIYQGFIARRKKGSNG